MDRALELGLLTAALGQPPQLPTAVELQQMLADAEVALFLRRTAMPAELLDAAWFLHAVASVDQAHELYTVARQRQAFAVSAHIFDLALSESRWSRADRLVLGFAAATGYRRSELDPNATAIVRRLRADFVVDEPVTQHMATLAVQAGLALLGFETRTLFGWFRRWRQSLQDLADLVGLDDLTTTAFGTTHAVVRGGEHLLNFLARGNRSRLDRAVEDFTAAALGQAGPAEHVARWVAAHLASLAEDAAAGSVFSLLPPDLLPAVGSAFTLTPPPVLTLWRPQRDLLNGPGSPLDPTTRRMVLSVPTSGGKTLLAQLLTVVHLAGQPTSVCYVAPTRSLCREVRRTMGGRLRMLQKEVGADAPDFPILGGLTAEDPWQLLAEILAGMSAGQGSPPDVEVMTPERLFHLVRNDPEAVLDRFGMFIIDEAQLIQERGRGFTLESLIAFLHYRTRQTSHRLVLISAALGNAGQIMQWIDPAGEGILHSSDWRGPRRLHAVFSAAADWDAGTVTHGKGSKYPYRMAYPSHGLIRLRPADGRPVRNLRTIDPIGTLTLKAEYATQSSGRQRDQGRSTQNYVVASTMITMLGHAGSVLVVTTSRATAERIAGQLATALPMNPPTVALADFARLQLGEAHPLVTALRHGVGFHHAGLPTEVLEAMEDALRNDLLPYLTCTSTLTEGINLPVRTVVIYDESHLPESRLSGARLVNAMGRAGRAGKESEGWIVLVRAAQPRDSDFDDLRPTDDDLTARSTLADPDALTAIAELEQAARTNTDAVFSFAGGAAADFVSFIWFALAAAESADTTPETADLNAVLDATLAAHQISAADRLVWTRAAESIRAVYAGSDPLARRRWSRAGTTLATARTLDELTGRLLDAIRALEIDDLDALRRPEPAIDFLTRLGVVGELLDLPENTSRWRFRTRATGADLDVAPEEVLRGWLQGMSLTELADQVLPAAPEPAWRITQLVDAVTAHFEHFLSWTLGALITLINNALAELGLEHQICPELAGYVRYGVRDPVALSLVLAGVRSRRLAHAVAGQLPDRTDPTGVAGWLSAMTLAEWRRRFQASSSEVLDLLDVTRIRRGGLLRPLLETGGATLSVRLVVPISDVGSPERVQLRDITDEPPPAPIGVFLETQLVATVPPDAHADMAAILDTGLDFEAILRQTVDGPTVDLTLATEGNET